MTQPASKRLVSEARLSDITTAATNAGIASAQSQINASAAAAASSATAAQNSANLVGAPAKSAMDTVMGGDTTNLVPTVAGKVSDVIAGTVGDGVANDATALQAALNTGRQVIDGRGRTYKINSSVTIPAGVTLRDCKIVLGTAGMNGLLVSDRSRLLQVHVYGTGTIGTTGSAFVERGIYPATDGASDVALDVTVENMTFGVHAQALTSAIPQRWTGRVRAVNIPGYLGNSEGYGVLLSAAQHCDLHVIGQNVQRHVFYITNGSSDNHAVVIASGGNHTPVQLYSKDTQAATRNNRVTLIADSLNAGVGTSATWACNLFGKVTGNHVEVTVRDSTIEGAVLLRSETSGSICRDNTVVAHAYGTGYIGDLIRSDAGVENTVELYGNGSTTAPGLNLIGARPYNAITVPTDAKHCIHIKRIVWNANGAALVAILSSVTALRTDIGKGVINLHNTTATANLTDSTSGRLDGWVWAESLAVSTASIAAGADGTASFTFTGNYQTLRTASLVVTMAGVTGSSNGPTVILGGLTATGATVYVKNNLATAASATVRLHIEGY